MSKTLPVLSDCAGRTPPALSFDDALEVTDVVRSGIANWFDAKPVAIVTTTGSLKLKRLTSPLTADADDENSAELAATETGSANLNVDADESVDNDAGETFCFTGERRRVSAVFEELFETAPTLELLLLALKLFVKGPATFDANNAGFIDVCRNPKFGNCLTSSPVETGLDRCAGSGSGLCSSRSTALSPSFVRTLPPDLPKSADLNGGSSDFLL